MDALAVPCTDDLVKEILKDPNRYIAETRRLSKHRDASAARWIKRSLFQHTSAGTAWEASKDAGTPSAPAAPDGPTLPV